MAESYREKIARTLFPDVFRAADEDVHFWRDEEGESGWQVFRRCRRTLEAVNTAYERLDAAFPALPATPAIEE